MKEKLFTVIEITILPSLLASLFVILCYYLMSYNGLSLMKVSFLPMISALFYFVFFLLSSFIFTYIQKDRIFNLLEINLFKVFALFLLFYLFFSFLSDLLVFFIDSSIVASIVDIYISNIKEFNLNSVQEKEYVNDFNNAKNVSLYIFNYTWNIIFSTLSVLIFIFYLKIFKKK